jgi:hypothetical protein
MPAGRPRKYPKGMRRCYRCKKVKPERDFYMRKDVTNHNQTYICKRCSRHKAMELRLSSRSRQQILAEIEQLRDAIAVRQQILRKGRKG